MIRLVKTRCKTSLMWKPLKLVPWLLTATFTWSLGYVYNVRHGGETSWLRAMYERKIAFAAQVKAPRRVLVIGGSGANYATDAKTIEQLVGIPTMNLGLDGPVGLNVILPIMLEQVRPGDIVLLIPEDLILRDEDGLLERSAPFGIAVGKPGLGGVPPKELAQAYMLSGVPTLRGLTKSSIDIVEKGKMTGYYSDPVDEHGDPTVTKVRHGKWWQWTIRTPITKHAIARIAQFRKEVQAKGGTLVLSLPWVYGKTDDEKTIANMRQVAQELGKIAPLIAYDKNTFNVKTNSSWFADTHHHLKPEIRKVRAKEIAEDLKPMIDNNQL